MSVDQLPEGDETEVWDLSQVFLPGEVIHVPAPEGDEDIADGVIEILPDRRPVLYETASAAMVVAAQIGRGAGLVSRPVMVGGRWTGVGSKHICILGWRYMRAHDHQLVLGGMSSDADWRSVSKTRKKRWKFSGIAAGVTAILDMIGWWAITAFADLPADTSLMLLSGSEAAAAVVAAATYGRYRLQRPGIPAGQILADEDMPGAEEDDEPYPLAWCKDGHQVEDCVSRALFAEGINTRRLKLTASHFWGRELDINLKGSTPGDVSKALEKLDAHLDIRQGGTMPESDPHAASHITLRLVQSDPFADMVQPQVHAPHSLSVHQPVAQGRAMDGTPFELTFDGFIAVVIGAMGAGKTLGALRTIAETLTACVDAVCWDLDALKDGLSEFGDLMEVRARGPEECEEALVRALSYVPARGRVMKRLKMGDRWKASRTHPHMYLFIDEYLQLTNRAKDIAIKLLRTGRQYGIYMIIAGQEATEDALGDAIAGVVPYRIAMACRFEDIKLLFGAGKGALGWRPDRMEPAVGEVVNDAGQSFIMGGPLNRPIRHRFHAYSREQIAEQAVPARMAAGPNRMDADTLLEAGHGLTSSGQATSLLDRIDKVTKTGDGDAELVGVLLRTFDEQRRAFLPTQELLLPALHDAGFDDFDATKLSSRLRKYAPDVKGGREENSDGKWLRGWHRTSVERAAAGLLDPVEARQNPGTPLA